MATAKLKQGNLNFESIRVADPIADTLIIFLHEALGSIPQWRSFPNELCQALKLNGIVYERQGHGKSDSLVDERTSRYLHEYAYKELPEFIESICAPSQKLLLVGHSDGGTIALLYASKYPKNIQAVVTIAAHVINEPETIAGIQPAVEAYKSGKLIKLKEFHGEKTDVLFNAWANTWNSADFINWDITSDIDQLSAPLLAMQGSKDQYGTLKQLELIKAHVQGLCVTSLIPDAGHHPHLEKQKELIQQVTDWLGTLGIEKH